MKEVTQFYILVYINLKAGALKQSLGSSVGRDEGGGRYRLQQQ